MSKLATFPAVALTAFALLAGASEPASAQIVTPITSDAQLTNARGITTNGTNLFVTSYGAAPPGRIFSVPVTGGTATQLYSYPGTAGAATPLSITTTGSNLYWVDPNSGPGTGTEVRRAPTNGAGPQTAIYTLGSPIVDASGIATNGTSLFIADEVLGGVYRMNLDGSGLTQLGGNRYAGFFDREHLNTIAVSGGTVFVADAGRTGFADTPSRVQSIPTTGGVFTDLFVGTLPGFSPQGIAIGNNQIYLTNGNQILQMPIGGGTPSLYASDPRFGTLGELTFFNNSLYVTDLSSSLGTRIWQVSPVPEPSSLALLGCGGVALVGYYRRRAGRVVSS